MLLNTMFFFLNCLFTTKCLSLGSSHPTVVLSNPALRGSTLLLHSKHKHVTLTWHINEKWLIMLPLVFWSGVLSH